MQVLIIQIWTRVVQIPLISHDQFKSHVTQVWTSFNIVPSYHVSTFYFLWPTRNFRRIGSTTHPSRAIFVSMNIARFRNNRMGSRMQIRQWWPRKTNPGWTRCGFCYHLFEFCNHWATYV